MKCKSCENEAESGIGADGPWQMTECLDCSLERMSKIIPCKIICNRCSKIDEVASLVEELFDLAVDMTGKELVFGEVYNKILEKLKS